MPIMLQNDTAYCAFQTDLELPMGLEVIMDTDEYVIDLTERKDRSHIVSCNRLADGAIRIFVTSQSVRPFNGNSGAIAIVKIRATSAFNGSGVVTLKGSIAVEENGLQHDLEDCTAYLNVTATGIRLSQNELIIHIGEQKTLSATVSPSTASQKVYWNSSDNSVVTVDQNGKVSAVGMGNATITATTTDGSNLSATCMATVSEKNMRGDVNGDGVVDVDDLNIVINIMVRKASMTNWPAADVDGNGLVDVDDLNIIINIMVRKDNQ